MSRDWRLYLADMRESGERVLRYTAGMDASSFARDEKTRDAVLRNLEIIGEAHSDSRASSPAEVGLASYRRFQDIVAHAYFGIDDAILWDIVRSKIPELLTALEQRGE